MALTPGMTVEDAENRLILLTLDHARGNKTRAAEILGISLNYGAASTATPPEPAAEYKRYPPAITTPVENRNMRRSSACRGGSRRSIW